MTNAIEERTRVAVVGAGSIGVRLACAFLERGVDVALSDPCTKRREAAPREAADARAALVEAGLASGVAPGALHVFAEAGAAVSGAGLAIECAPERLDLKRAVFAELDAAAPPHTPLASASSALVASEFAANLPGRARCLVAHPVNPPHVIRLIELVPAPFTSPAAIAAAGVAFKAAGFRTVTAGRETTGFIFNRLQGSVLREAYCLVRDGVATVDDIDLLMREGLGLRWSVVGPFESIDLNTRGGISAHAEKLGAAYHQMGRERGQDDPWTPDLVEKVAGVRRATLPLADWEARVAWRDRMLAALVEWRRDRLN